MSKILFALTGSIACFKACEVISSLTKLGHSVQTVATDSALQFIGSATLEGLTNSAVLTSSYETGKMMSHIHAVRNSDIFVICPATAHTINGLAAGTLDGILGDLYLANNFNTKILIFPAMNSQMLSHPATIEALEKLKKWGAEIYLGEEGSLACGEYGSGRLMEPTLILKKIESHLARINQTTTLSLDGDEAVL